MIWSSESWHGMWSGINFLGKRDVKDPDFAYKPNADKLGITFAHDAQNAPVAVNGMLTVSNVRPIDGIAEPINTIATINGQYFVGSKYNFWTLDADLKPVVSAAYDPWYSANVLDLAVLPPIRMMLSFSWVPIRRFCVPA
ncbi:disulfide bond formation protein, DsbB family [gut metagenome]|uniref:Disulfide bond formation protein, DsbB family n=1 Tax=gut metagenome TaxID=749906 RepID=J9GDH1_9ZZZZ